MTKTPVTPEIQWHEGMLLSPQHFQQMELRNQQILTYHLHRLSPFYWGIHHLKFDSVVLNNGIIRILEIDAVMPDGLIVSHFGDTNSLLEIDLTPFHNNLSKEEMTVFLVVPERTLTNSPVIGEHPRYISVESDDIIDDNSPDNVIRIPRLMPKVSLIINTTPPPRFEYIPIAKVVYQDEAYLLKPFVPPCFFVHQNSLLWQKLAALTLRMREKASYLTEKWQNQIGTELLEETTALLRPLAESLPLLEAVVSTNKTHPYDLYLILCSLAGRLIPLRLGQPLPSFPAYHHNDILKTIDPLLDWMDRIISSIERTYTIVPFLQKDRLFYHKLSSQWAEEKLLIGIRSPLTMDPQEMAEWVRECVIASESHLESARLRRVTGAAREVVLGDELTDRVPGSGLLLYHITVDPQYIKPGENLMIFHAADQPDKRPVAIVLYTKGPYSQEIENTEQEG